MNQFVTSEDPLQNAFFSGNYSLVYQSISQQDWQNISPTSDEPIYFLWSSFHHKGEFEIQKTISLFEQTEWYTHHLHLQNHIQLWQASQIARKKGNYDVLKELAHQSESIESPLLKAILFSELTQCHFNNFDYKSAIVCLSRSLYYAKECNWETYILLQTIELARIHFMQLNLDMCLHYVHEFMQYLKRPNLNHHERYFMQASAMFMQIHYVLNELEHCDVFCQNWLRLISKTRLNHWLFGLLPLLEIMLNLSKTETLKVILTQIESQLLDRQNFELLNITQKVISCRIKIRQAVERHNPLEISKLYQGMAQDSGFYQKSKDLNYFYHSQLFLLSFHLKHVEEAAIHLEQLYQGIRLFENSTMYLVYLNHLSALQKAIGNEADAQETLCSLLYKIQDCGYVRLFSDYYLSHLQDLRKAIETCSQVKSLKPGFIEQLEQIFNVSFRNEETSLLSEREAEILELLSQSFSNQEMAQKMFISVNTVKFHIKNIYQKLGVSNRQKALKKAVELGLLKH